MEYTVDGTRYRTKAKTGSSIRKSRNTKIKIKYNPNNPEEIIMLNDLSRFVLLIIGPLFTVGGIFITIKAAKGKGNGEELSGANTVVNELLQQNGYNNPEVTNQTDTNVSENTNNNNQNNINM